MSPALASQQWPDLAVRNRSEPSSDFPSITPQRRPRFLHAAMQADTMHLPAPPTRVLCPCHPLNNQAGAPVSGPYPAIISVSNTLSPEGDTTPSLLPLRSQHKQQTNLQTSLLKPSTFPSLLTLHPSTLPLIFSCRAHKNI